jgi:hypothetical protein
LDLEIRKKFFVAGFPVTGYRERLVETFAAAD